MFMPDGVERVKSAECEDKREITREQLSVDANGLIGRLCKDACEELYMCKG
jgi:hypothetical protein